MTSHIALDGSSVFYGSFFFITHLVKLDCIRLVCFFLCQRQCDDEQKDSACVWQAVWNTQYVIGPGATDGVCSHDLCSVAL